VRFIDSEWDLKMNIPNGKLSKQSRSNLQLSFTHYTSRGGHAIFLEMESFKGPN